MLRELQKERLKNMLQPEEAPFKILVLDEETKVILSALLRVSDLRACGVTVHLLLEAPRSEARDVPAVFFTGSAPLGELRSTRYGSYFLHAASSHTREDLEALALEASSAGVAKRVCGVFDAFLAFSAIHDDLFTLNLRRSFVEREENMAAAVAGLLSVFVTLGEAPVIAGDASGIAAALARRIRGTGLLKPGTRRPLLILLDRDFDLVSPLRLSLGYATLVLETDEQSSRIDGDCAFFAANRFEDFPVVAERVEAELLSYKKALALRSLGPGSDRAAVAQALEDAPALQKQHALVDTHLAICERILKSVRARHLDDFFHASTALDPEELPGLAEAGVREDILRLALALIGGKHDDLVDPLLTRCHIDSPLPEVFRRRRGPAPAGLRERVRSLFKREASVAPVVEAVLAQVRTQAPGDFPIADPFNTGIYLAEISRIVVYIHGGATYTELAALKEVEKTHRIPITLGGSEIFSANEFISQAEELYAKST